MEKLLILNTALVALCVCGLWIVKKYAKTARTQNIILIAASLSTIAFHYSSFIARLVSGSNAMEYLSDNPNLILPIYPCNVVMWSALIFALLKNKKSRFGSFLADYLFWFGIISTLVGMFANMDFIKNPTLADYENIKSIVTHAILLFNVLLPALFGYIKVNVIRNITNIIVSIVVMALIGGYCTITLWALNSKEFAYYKNSMFLLHSPFEGLDFLTYPIIVLIAIPIYLLLFIACDICVHKKGDRFVDKLRDKIHQKNKIRIPQKLSPVWGLFNLIFYNIFLINVYFLPLRK